MITACLIISFITSLLLVGILCYNLGYSKGKKVVTTIKPKNPIGFTINK